MPGPAQNDASMADRAAIQDVITTYSQHASRGDWDTVLSLFLPEAVWDIPHLGMHLDGREAIAAALSGFMAHMDYVLQLNAPALVRVTGDSAVATSGIREHGKSKGVDEGFEYLGLYEDALERTAQGWKFRTRVFRQIGTHFTPLRPG